MKKICLMLAIACGTFISSAAQDMQYTRKIVDTLTSPFFWGRGYTNDGMKKAAAFIAAEMKTLGLQPVGKDFLQEFSYPANTFPGDMEVSINNKLLVPGVDYIVMPESKGAKAKGELVARDANTFIDPRNRIIVSLKDKLTWSVAPEAADYTGIEVLNTSVSNPTEIKVKIDQRFVSKFKASNVIGMVKGREMPDSFLVVTAHYDHLGGMGSNTYFPGANDNASGISMLLNLARHYAANPHRYSVVFIAFAGEEAGLVGSRYFTDNPLMNLKQIRFLLNLDLVGTGDEGITVVNATEFKNEFDAMVRINTEKQLLAAVNARGKAANSDHHWFTEKGVPSFFVYTLGGIKAYHDVFDRSATLPYTDYSDLFQLIVAFHQTFIPN